MKRLFALITLSLIIHTSWTTAKLSNQQNTQIYYNMSKNTNQGAHRVPTKSSNLPITWLEEGKLHFIWQTDVPNVSICILNGKNQTDLYKETIGVKGKETIVDVSDLENGKYTLVLMINGFSNFADFKI